MAELRFVSHSEIGLVRKNNQDSGFASPTLLVVADGMGGAAAGDLASAVAIDTIKRIVPDPQSGEDPPTAGEEMLEVLAGAIHKANDRIADLVASDYSLDGMGTTVTSAMFDGTALGVAHIGDSRAYLLRDGILERLTHDHSWVQSLVDEGKISLEEAAVHPHRSLLLKVLNGQAANDPDLTIVAAAPRRPADAVQRRRLRPRRRRDDRRGAHARDDRRRPGAAGLGVLGRGWHRQHHGDRGRRGGGRRHR